MQPNVQPATPLQDEAALLVVVIFPVLAVGSAIIGYFSYLEGCSSPLGCAPWWKVLLGVLAFEGTLLAIPIVVYWWRRRELRRQVRP